MSMTAWFASDICTEEMGQQGVMHGAPTDYQLTLRFSIRNFGFLSPASLSIFSICGTPPIALPPMLAPEKSSAPMGIGMTASSGTAMLTKLFEDEGTG